MHFKMINKISLVIIQSYYNIIDYIPHVVYFIHMTHLFYNRKSHLFHPSPHPLPLWLLRVFVSICESISVLLGLVICFLFLDFTYK